MSLSKKIIIIFLGWVVCLFVINKVSNYFLENKTSYEIYYDKISLPQKLKPIILPWLNFDGRNYFEIAVNWYRPFLYMKDGKGFADEHHYRVFFPLYPGLIKILSFNSFINPIFIGLLISYASFLASLFLIKKILTKEKINQNKILKIIICLISFPTGFYFLGFYTESLFLLLSLLVFYYLDKKNYLLSSIFCALATGTRIVGVTLIFPIIYEIYKEYKSTKKINWSFLLTPLGLIFYMIYTQIASGNALNIYLKEENWGKTVSLFGPFKIIYESINKIINGLIKLNLNSNYLIEVTEFFTILIFIFIIFYLYKKIKMSYWIFITTNILIILLSGSLSSVHRYVAILFPIYFFIGEKIKSKYYYLIISIFIFLQIIFAGLFLRGYWVA